MNGFTDRRLAEVNKKEKGLGSTKTEVNIQKWGLGFSSPKPPGQPSWHDVRCLWTTSSSSIPLLLILHGIAFLVNKKRYPVYCGQSFWLASNNVQRLLWCQTNLTPQLLGDSLPMFQHQQLYQKHHSPRSSHVFHSLSPGPLIGGAYWKQYA